MFKVVCINDNSLFETPNVIRLKKGNIYHVIEENDRSGYKTRCGKKAEEGMYYMLFEIGNKFVYHHSLFIVINEQEIDETEFIREQLIEKA